MVQKDFFGTGKMSIFVPIFCLEWNLCAHFDKKVPNFVKNVLWEVLHGHIVFGGGRAPLAKNEHFSFINGSVRAFAGGGKSRKNEQKSTFLDESRRNFL